MQNNITFLNKNISECLFDYKFLDMRTHHPFVKIWKKICIKTGLQPLREDKLKQNSNPPWYK